MHFDNIIGNEEIKNYLLNIVKEKRLTQSYLFSGTEGIGKLLIAKEFAKKILCLNNGEDNCECKSCKCFENSNHPDSYIVNENGKTIQIDQVRELVNKIIEQPVMSEKKVYIINDFDKMTIPAQNAFLKTLEEPPEFVVIILISSNENAILNTIKSRCMTIKFKNISNEELKKYAIDKLEYTQMTEIFLKSLNGSIGKAIVQKENQEEFAKVEDIVNGLSTDDIINIMNSAKIIYNKEKINQILDYMIICVYSKAQENKAYLDCVIKINDAIEHLKRNANFDMTIDTMLFEMYECVKKGI